MNKHTPGPWKIVRRTIKAEDLQPEFRVNEIIADIGSIENVPIAMVMDADSFKPSDSTLIAAAPDLYEACRQAYIELHDQAADQGITKFDRAGTVAHLLLQAIEKAEGKKG